MTPEKAAKRHPHCGVEGHAPAHRFEVADAYACLVCDVWLEARCTAIDCGLCANRSERPSVVEAQ